MAFNKNKVMDTARKFCMLIFPDKERQFELIHAPRFQHILRRRFPNVIRLFS